MKAVDTNVLLRVIVNDDPAQAAAALRTLAGPTFVSFGVLIETAWVLGSTYRQPRAAIADALSAILDIGTLTTPDDRGIRWALGRYRDHGAELADMMHIVAGRSAVSFSSFEKQLARLAGPDSPLPVERPA